MRRMSVLYVGLFLLLENRIDSEEKWNNLGAFTRPRRMGTDTIVLLSIYWAWMRCELNKSPTTTDLRKNNTAGTMTEASYWVCSWVDTLVLVSGLIVFFSLKEGFFLSLKLGHCTVEWSKTRLCSAACSVFNVFVPMQMRWGEKPTTTSSQTIC